MNEQDDVQRLERARALKAIRHTRGFAVLQELVLAQKLMLFQKWSAGVKENGVRMPRAFCDGYNLACDELISAVDNLVSQVDEFNPTEPRAAISHTILGQGEAAG